MPPCAIPCLHRSCTATAGVDSTRKLTSQHGTRADAWAHAPWTDDFVDIEGDRKENPTWQTRVKMLWDDEALYVGAWMEVGSFGSMSRNVCICRLFTDA